MGEHRCPWRDGRTLPRSKARNQVSNRGLRREMCRNAYGPDTIGRSRGPGAPAKPPACARMAELGDAGTLGVPVSLAGRAGSNPAPRTPTPGFFGACASSGRSRPRRGGALPAEVVPLSLVLPCRPMLAALMAGLVWGLFLLPLLLLSEWRRRRRLAQWIERRALHPWPPGELLWRDHARLLRRRSVGPQPRYEAPLV